MLENTKTIIAKKNKRSRRASLIKRVASLYKSGRFIPRALLRARTKA